MFKSAIWRSEKNKIKAVFKLQFHVTQLTQLGGDALVISVIPADTGKPTAKLEKAKVKDGSCFWEKPHYEIVKFTWEQKTGKFHEKIYRFVVATGPSLFGGVGEVSIDFASYVGATKLSSLSLPLKNASSAAVLHVSIQRMQDHREVDGIENASDQDRILRAQFSNGDIEESIRSDHTRDNGTLSDNVNRDCRASSGSDITPSSPDSSSGLDTPQEPKPKNTKPTHESSTTIYEEQHQRSSQWDWLYGSAPESSTDDSSTSPTETLLREISEEGSRDAVIKKLEAELVFLVRQTDVLELELQTLRKQIAKESKKSQDLSREVATLKEERNAFKEECEKLKVNQKRAEEVKVNDKLLIEGGDPWVLVNELRQELNYEKDLNSNLRLQLEKTQESNAELILAVQDLDEMLERKDSEMSKSKCSQEVNSKYETDDDEEQKALEEIVREHSGLKDAHLQEQKTINLYDEIELYKRDKDELEMQMEQIALDYEILKQENQDMSYKLEQSQLLEQLTMQYECSTSYATVIELKTQIESLNNEVKTKSKELSKSILAIKELEFHVKNLEEDLENQAHGFEADLEDLTRAKIEQEQRAIRAEENLRKVRLQNANMTGRLQDEFRRLSTQMASAFEANEKVAMKAMDEANQLRIEKMHLQEMLKKVQEDYEDKMFDLSKAKQLEKLEKQTENMSLELEHQKSSCRAEIERLKTEKQNLEDERKELEIKLKSSRKELIELMGVKKDKDSEIERLKLKTECLKSRCKDMKLFFIEYETENENLTKTVSRLKGDLRKKDEAFRSIEKKLLESQIKLKETALESSENLFLEKEKDLQHEIEELERRLEVLDQNTENSSPNIIRSVTGDDASKTGDQEDFDELSNEMAILKNRNKAIEVELKEMQERYSEISLKFAEVEGEREQLVMTLRNLTNAKKC